MLRKDIDAVTLAWTSGDIDNPSPPVALVLIADDEIPNRYHVQHITSKGQILSNRSYDNLRDALLRYVLELPKDA